MAGQKFTLTFDANLNVNQMKSSLSQIQSALNGLHLPQNMGKGLQGTFDKLSKEIQNFEALASKDITGKTDFGKLQTSADKIITTFETLKNQVRDLGKISGADLEKLFPAQVSKNIASASNAIKTYQTNLNAARTAVTRAQSEVDKFNQKIQDVSNKKPLSNDDWKKLKDDITAAEAEVDKYKTAIEDAQNKAAAVEARTSNYKNSSIWRQAQKDITAYTTELQKAENKLKGLTTQQANSMTYSKQTRELADLNVKLTEANNKLQTVKSALDLIESKASGGGLSQLIQEIGRLTGLDMTKFSADFKGVGDALTTYFNQAAQKASGQIQNLGNAVSGAQGPIQTLGDNIRDSGNALRDFLTQGREIDMLRSRIQYFFGLNNAINLVKRTMREAYQTIKELDKAMTETAVVTNFSVGDMWAQLPDYTRRANELGVSTKAAYEAATLYYQQGLNTNEVMAMSNETLKMARIAGLDAAVATDRMTNAIRGFNMEINTMNAQRIDDVYSKLAAISASNVDEISTAMTKVASLAHNANMEFETTAAFLAQIIETTRESAETAGTALKTVVARFSEVKKLVDENQLRGQDEEGQVIDVNRVSQALRTAGIDLNKYFLGEVGLDDIFMELASKWDSLTTIQQRYIATQAAGSRQQSRFIALMSDYARTQELVGEAYNANGAAAKQFAKTQKSLESKLARLKNAWDEFAMGILNSDLVKVGVDLLTNILNGINALTSGFGALDKGIGGVINSALKLITLLGALRLGSGIIGGIAGGTQGIASAMGLASPAGGALATLGMGLINPFTKISGKIQSFKNNNAAYKDPTWYLNPKVQRARQEYFNARRTKDLQAISAARNNYGQVKAKAGGIYATPNTLFGALGNKFVGTKVGGAISTGLGSALGKLGIGSGAALGGAATLAATLGVVAAVGTTAYVIIKKLYDASPAGQVKIAEKYASAMSAVADEARKAESDIKKVQESYNNYNEAIDKANTSSERSTAIQERNDYITSLLEQNSAYAEYLTTTFENGEILLTLDSDALAAAVDKIAEGAVKASTYSEIANAILSGQQANLYRSKLAGIDLENRTHFEGVDSQTGETYYSNLSDAEYAKYLHYQTQAERSDAQMRSYVEHAAAQLIDTNILSDETASVVAHFISEGFNAADIQSKVDSQKRANWWEGNATENQLRAEYVRLYGTQAAEGTKKSELAQSVAFAQVMEETTGAQIEKLQGLLTGKNGSLYENILSAASGIGEINSVNLSNINFEDGAEELFSALNIDPANFEALETAAGLAAGSLQKQIIAQSKLIKDIQKVNKTKIYDNLLHAGIDVTKAVQDMVNNMSPEQAEKIADITTKVQGTLSPELYRELLTHIPQLMQSEELNDIQNFFNSFDLSDPINAFLQLRAAEEKAQPRGMFEGLLKAIEQTNAALFDSGNLFQTFLTSSEYNDLTESLDEFIEKNGEISGENIEELAKNCKGLKAVLDNDKISAQGLAKALTALQQGNAPIEGLTTRVLEALSSFNDFNTMLKEISDTIANFDPGRDFGEGSDFLVQQADNLLELIDGYEFGNEQTRNIYDLFFGKGAYDNFMSEWGARGIEEYADLMKAQVEQLKDWADSNSYGFMRDFAGNQALGITQIGDYDFKWDTQGRTTEQLIAEVQKQANISREAAEMVIEGFAAQSYDFATELQQNDYSAFLEDFSTSASNTRTITEQELAALGAAFGKTSDEIYADLEKLRNEKGIDIPIRVNWQDENGANLTGEALFNEFTKKIGNFQEYVQDYMNNGQIDASALLGGLTSTGLTSSQASEVADKIASSIDGAMLSKTISIPKLDEDGITITSEDITISADSMEGLTAAENAAIEAANYELVAQKLAEQDLSGLQTNLDTVIINAGTNLTTTLSAACTAVDASGIGTAITNAGAIAASNIQSLIASTPMYGTVILTATGTAAGALGGIVTSYARGSANRKIQPGWALTGEEAPEIVWNKERGYAYITGAKGPEFRTLYPGDRVFNAQETSRILRNSKTAKNNTFGSYASGGYNPNRLSDDSDSGGGSGNDKAKEDKWKNEIDWLYNLVEDIAELERIQTKLQEDYEDYLQDNTKTGKDLYKLLVEQLGNLYTQLNHQESTLELREREMREFMDTTNQYDELLWYNWNDRTLEIDWDAIEALEDKDTYNEIAQLISEAEEIQKKMDDAEDSVIDIRNKIQELENIWRETYVDFESRVINAVISYYQEIIDNYSELNETLNNSNSEILNSLQKQIALERQIRDNTQAEESINNAEAQLAFLRRDTTGGNELASLRLQKDLNDQRQSYEDTLIDQAISRLQDSNDVAAQQREKQIEIMQAQLDYQQESGDFNQYVRDLLESAMGADGELLTNSDLMTLLKDQENWSAMSEVSKEVWEEELNTTFKEVAAFLLKQNAEEDGTFTSALTGAIQGMTSAIGSYSQPTIKIDYGAGTGGGGGSGGGSSSGYSGSATQDSLKKQSDIYQVVNTRTEQILFQGDETAAKAQAAWYGGGNVKVRKKYKLGGLNTFTGPAWLDGTPSEPEYVLNARQTDAFLRLADVLPSMMQGNTTNNSTTLGGVNLNLVMNVDQIASDYDVDRIADRVKEIVYNAGQYRNVNTLNFIR